jgi:hypothetical protein
MSAWRRLKIRTAQSLCRLFCKRRQSFYDDRISLDNSSQRPPFFWNQRNLVALDFVGALQFQGAGFHIKEGQGPVRLELKGVLPADIAPGDMLTTGGQT